MIAARKRYFLCLYGGVALIAFLSPGSWLAGHSIHTSDWLISLNVMIINPIIRIFLPLLLLIFLPIFYSFYLLIFLKPYITDLQIFSLQYGLTGALIISTPFLVKHSKSPILADWRCIYIFLITTLMTKLHADYSNQIYKNKLAANAIHVVQFYYWDEVMLIASGTFLSLIIIYIYYHISKWRLLRNTHYGA